ncbi:hypothetical protein K470DRAFT_266408 [Piedraia hortae CBS 480.64]|uniref:Uncharacterized protein n=1 Tax=Piedraia hortae CBS 480.64 TaxID=1314780 RepID=A0A6A7BRS3_9PEZI|nr:hypothetical protein K470DRAFT_266408 [Piedraia hortae CBS 480.64]
MHHKTWASKDDDDAAKTSTARKVSTGRISIGGVAEEKGSENKDTCASILVDNESSDVSNNDGVKTGAATAPKVKEETQRPNNPPKPRRSRSVGSTPAKESKKSTVTTTSAGKQNKVVKSSARSSQSSKPTPKKNAPPPAPARPAAASPTPPPPSDEKVTWGYVRAHPNEVFHFARGGILARGPPPPDSAINVTIGPTPQDGSGQYARRQARIHAEKNPTYEEDDFPAVKSLVMKKMGPDRFPKVTWYYRGAGYWSRSNGDGHEDEEMAESHGEGEEQDKDEEMTDADADSEEHEPGEDDQESDGSSEDSMQVIEG